MLQTHLRTLPRKYVAVRKHTNLLRSSHRNLHITGGGTSGHPKWGIFSDMHFQHKDLPRIVETSEWITESFRQQQVSQIFCLGDVLNTREDVNVQALSATAKFFDELKTIAPVHIVLGNHDMNLKHSSRLSSLDFFSMQELRKAYKIYRDMEAVMIEGVPCLMVPWVENHATIVDRLGEIPSDRKKETILFGHLAVAGAVQQPALSENSRFRTHSGILTGRHLAGFRSAYLGHFHHHQRLQAGDGPANVWYVGAPMQHHFADKGDEKRGLVLLDPLGDPGELHLVQNPKWDVFRDIKLEEIRAAAEAAGGVVGAEELVLPKLPFDVQGKRIAIKCSAIDAPEYEKWRTVLIEAGATDVRRSIEVIHVPRKPVVESSVVKQEAEQEKAENEGKEMTPQREEETFRAPTTATFIEQLPEFLATVPEELNLVSPHQHAAYIATAARLMNLADQTMAGGNNSSSSLPVFHGTIKKLTMSNFFAIQGTLEIKFDQLAPGTYFLTGANGAGKSTVLEAVAWGLFGQVLRSDMAAADPVNDIIRKNCCVSIEFENGYKIERFRNFPAKSGGGRGPGLKLYKDGVEVEGFERGEMNRTQEALQRDVLGCDFATFTKSVVFGDEGVGAGNFLSLGSAARRDVLEELLGISNYESYLQVVRDERRALTKEHLQLKARAENMESTLAGITNERDGLQASLPPKEVTKAQLEKSLLSLVADEEKLKKDRETMGQEQGEMLKWNTVYDKVLRQLEVVRRLEEQLAMKTQLRDDALATLEKIQRVKATIQPQWVSLTSDANRVRGDVQRVDMESRRTQDRIRELDSKITRFSGNVAAGICPTCRQGLEDPKHVKNHIEVYKVERDEAHKRAGELEAQKASFAAQLGKIDVDRIALLQRHAVEGITEQYLISIPEKERDVNYMLSTTEIPIRHLESDIRRAHQELQTLLDGHTKEQVAVLAHRDSSQNTSSLEAAMEANSSMLRRTQELHSRRNQITTALTRLTTELTLSNSQLLNLSSQIDSLTADLEASTSRMRELDEQTRIVLFWESAFNKKQASTSNIPNMRQFLIATSINELNTLIKTNMAILTTPTSTTDPAALEEMSITQDIPLAFTPDLQLDPPSAYGKRSSGQRKRNNLAVMFALFQLIRQRSRFRADFIMLDEVFDALDQAGQVQASELINRITTEGDVKHVIVVTHSEGLSDEVIKVGHGGGSRVLKVVRGERGTEILDNVGGRIEHVWTVKDSEIGVPEIETEFTERKRVGRKKKNVSPVEGEEEAISEEGEVVPKKRGRKKKVMEVEEGSEGKVVISQDDLEVQPKKRGRKKKVKDVEEAAEGVANEVVEVKEKKRGRKKKVVEAESDSE